MDTVYIYITINPEKKLSPTLEKCDKDSMEAHYTSLIEYSRKSDMSFST
jgi:hypothetical protein